MSDRVATPEEKPPMTFEDLKSRFAEVTKPRGGSVEMGEVGGGKPSMIRQGSQGFNDVDRSDANFSPEETKLPSGDDPFEGMDFGEFKGQGGNIPRSDPMDFQTDPALQPDALGGGNGGQSVATRNVAGASEQDAMDITKSPSALLDDGSDLAPYYQGLNRPSLVNSTGDQALNAGDQILKDGGKGADLLTSGLGDAAKVAGTEGAETATSGALETAGAVLDATPFAPFVWCYWIGIRWGCRISSR